MRLSIESVKGALPIYVMFFVSGVASLILQVVWFKQLQFMLGSSTSAVSITIASFFLGLSVGAHFGGRLADRTPRLLRAYGLVESSIAGLALLVTFALNHWASWIDPLLPAMAFDSPWRTPVTLLIGFGFLLLPTMGMGATLPFLARFVVAKRQQVAQRIGVLYGINTLGAASGALVVGFFLIEWLGVTGSAGVAIGLYLCIALIAIVLDRNEEPRSIEAQAEDDAEDDDAAAPTDTQTRNLLIGVFALSGFISIAYEVIWFRLLSTVAARSVYAFSSMLAVYLLGLVAGSLICARFFAPRKEQLLANFARVQILIGASAMLSLALLGKMSTLKAWLDQMIQGVLPHSLHGLLAGGLSVNLASLIVFGIPTTLIGIGFPLASELTIQRVGVVGKGIGRLYSLNTLGGVLGSLAAGFLLLPWLGSFWALVIMVVLNVGLAGVLILRTELRHTIMRREFALACMAVAIIVFTLGPDYITKQLTAYNHAELLELRESKDATFVVLEYGTGEDRFVQLLSNGTSYANNSMPGRRYMGALAHLPTLLHPDPKSAVVICIGTGTTVGALTTHDSLEDIYAVDLSQDVFDFAPYFVPINESFHLNPRVHKIAADGRHYLLSSKETFDVLTFEPPPPDDAGVVNLYSEEFYQIARQRMNSEGIIAQWIPMTMARGELSKVLIRAMLNEFKHVSLWVTNRMEGIALASDNPLFIDEEILRARMAEPRVRASLRAIGMETPEDLLGTFIAADDALVEWIGDTPTVTDDRPRIEYHRSFEVESISPEEIAGIRQDIAPYFKNPPQDPVGLKASSDAVLEANRTYFSGTKAEKLIHAKRASELRPDNLYYRWLFQAQLPK